ncbi:hypothetical protein JW992_13815, partial [candidate division KSB1 bacterium]|nr:hypothetical protein [candidate division KSB1 bacterium]
GFVYHTGLFGVIYFLTWSFAFFVGYRITAARWRRSRVLSPVEYTQTRYNVTTQQLVAYVMVVNGLLARGIVLTAVSKIIASSLQVPIEYVILISGLVILIYTLLGGLWAVAITDVVQFIILLVITVLVVPISLHAVGGIRPFIEQLPALQMEHLYKGIKYDIHYLIAITAINLLVANWGAAQRYYSVKDERDAKRVGLTCSLLFLTVPLLFGIPPLVARMIWPDLGAISFFQGDLVPEDLVYVGMVLKAMPNGLIGFFLAAMFAATMSTLDTTYNIDSSIISKDLYGKMINPNASDEQLLTVGKIATIVLGLSAIGTALLYSSSTLGIFNLMVVVTSLFAIPISVPMAFGLVFKHLPRWSAVSAISFGLVASAAGKFLLGWSVGPQVYGSIVASFGGLLLAEPLGRLYRRSPLLNRLLALALGVGLFWLFYRLSNNPPQGTTLVLIALCAAFYALGTAFFSQLFAREDHNDRMIVEQFFIQLDKPVDVAREVYGAGIKPISTFPIVGLVTALIGILVELVAFLPMTAQDRIMTVLMGVLLIGIGALMFFFGGQSERIFLQLIRDELAGRGEEKEL